MFKFNSNQSRRGFLTATGVAMSVGLAGCTDEGNGDNGDDDTQTEEGPTGDDNSTAAENESDGIGGNVTDSPDNETLGGDENETDE